MGGDAAEGERPRALRGVGEGKMRSRGRRRCRCCGVRINGEELTAVLGLVSKSTRNIVGRLILIQRLEGKKVTWKHQNSEIAISEDDLYRRTALLRMRLAAAHRRQLRTDSPAAASLAHPLQCRG
uniref:Uncharacterized protein n=1 Tax=Oryza rufipogon TaxID=4529 RepID=A0A0E0MYW8_ORYRU